jgi:glycerate kinase
MGMAAKKLLLQQILSGAAGGMGGGLLAFLNATFHTKKQKAHGAPQIHTN